VKAELKDDIASLAARLEAALAEQRADIDKVQAALQTDIAALEANRSNSKSLRKRTASGRS
jgi:hypothetical protein